MVYFGLKAMYLVAFIVNVVNQNRNAFPPVKVIYTFMNNLIPHLIENLFSFLAFVPTNLTSHMATDGNDLVSTLETPDFRY